MWGSYRLWIWRLTCPLRVWLCQFIRCGLQKVHSKDSSSSAFRRVSRRLITMEDPSCSGLTSIMHLPDDCLFFIFQWLDCTTDRESFGLTCRRWLQIQNLSRRSLQFACSFTHLSLSSLAHPNFNVSPFQLHRLLTRFQHLQSLSLSGCLYLPDSGLTPLQHYGSNLQAIHFDCCFSITDHGVSLAAAACPLLVVVSLYRCHVTDVGLESLANACSGLKQLNLSHCSKISDFGLGALSRGCRQLQAVRISFCSGLTGIGFRGCSSTLAYVEAESCSLEPDGIEAIVSGGGIEYLDVSCINKIIFPVKGPHIEDVFAAIGGGFASSLRILNFRMCRTVRDASILAIAKGCPQLQEWNLALCHEVKISGWMSIGTYCNKLEKLPVNRCRNLCDQGLLALRNGCQRLSVLYMNGCVRLTSTAIELFKFYRGDVNIKEEEVVCIAPNWAFRWLEISNIYLTGVRLEEMGLLKIELFSTCVFSSLRKFFFLLFYCWRLGIYLYYFWTDSLYYKLTNCKQNLFKIHLYSIILIARQIDYINIAVVLSCASHIFYWLYHRI